MANRLDTGGRSRVLSWPWVSLSAWDTAGAYYLLDVTGADIAWGHIVWPVALVSIMTGEKTVEVNLGYRFLGAVC